MRLLRFSIAVMVIAIAIAGATMISAQTPAACVNRVTVWDNESLNSIARREGVDVNALAAANGLTVNARLQIGQVLCLDGLKAGQPAQTPGGATITATVPVTGTPRPTGTLSGTTTPVTGRFMRGQNPTVPAGWQTYTVVQGDNLTRISVRYGVSQQAIITANNIADPRIIFLGETLLIPPSNVTVTATIPTTPVSTPIASTPAATSVTGGNVPPAGAGTIPVITLNPVRARSGDTVSVTGSNYPPNATVDLYIEKKNENRRSAILATVTADANGTFTSSVVIPNTWSDGSAVNQTTVSISGYTRVGGFWAMNFFVNTGGTTTTPATPAPGTTATVVPATPSTVPTLPAGANTVPLIGLNPSQAKPGDTIVVTGSNFPPNARIEIFIERPALGLKSGVLGTVTSDASGNFTYNLTIPATWGTSGVAVNQNIVSVSAYATGGYWGMNFFVNTAAAQ